MLDGACLQDRSARPAPSTSSPTAGPSARAMLRCYASVLFMLCFGSCLTAGAAYGAVALAMAREEIADVRERWVLTSATILSVRRVQSRCVFCMPHLIR